MMMQHQSDKNQGVDELLLQEYEQFLSHVTLIRASPNLSEIRVRKVPVLIV
jgi:hypothetical protein